jgi:hypothetical protein
VPGGNKIGSFRELPKKDFCRKLRATAIPIADATAGKQLITALPNGNDNEPTGTQNQITTSTKYIHAQANSIIKQSFIKPCSN